jgi:TetR/AcrR family transcriptional regulator, tetracycline repressor protein
MSATRPLTESGIVSAALAVIERDGVESLSMRALSRELGVSPMAAYYYVKSKEELLDLVAARVLAGIAPPARPDLEWPARLRLLIDQIEAALRHHRGIGDVLLDRMHNTQRHVMRAIMELLSEAGFDDQDVVMAYALIHTYLFGRYRVTTQPPPKPSPAVVGEEPTEDEDIVTRIRPLFPKLRGRDYYDFGIETLILGLQRQLELKRP